MKKLFFILFGTATLGGFAQIKTPQPSPASTIKQTIGITDVEIVYSRPAARERKVFGDLVPFDKMWRTGANKNTTIENTDVLIFGNDTLLPGTYAIFTKPSKTAWEIYFYTDASNWGTPEKWEEDKVALKVTATPTKTSYMTESFTIGFEDVQKDGAILSLTWENTDVNIPFKVATKERVFASIDKVMAGPSSNDYYRAAEYYLTEKKDLKKALEWMNKSLEMRDDAPFWMLRRKSLIQAELGDLKGAIETAKKSLEGAKEAKNDAYIKMNEESIKEWTK